jgi:hypothetical protein
MMQESINVKLKKKVKNGFSLLHNRLACPLAHTASCTMNTGYSGQKEALHTLPCLESSVE